MSSCRACYRRPQTPASTSYTSLSVFMYLIQHIHMRSKSTQVKSCRQANLLSPLLVLRDRHLHIIIAATNSKTSNNDRFQRNIHCSHDAQQGSDDNNNNYCSFCIVLVWNLQLQLYLLRTTLFCCASFCFSFCVPLFCLVATTI